MNKFKQLSFAIMVSALAVLFLFSSAFALDCAGPKVDNFILFQDYSGSMAMTHADLGMKKIEASKKAMMDMDKTIPNLGYTGALYTFAPFGAVSAPAAHTPGSLAGAIGSLETDYDIFGRRTPMGYGLIDLDPVLAGLKGSTAIIMFTDGAHNQGVDPVAEAKALYAKYGDKVCIHVVSYADTAHGQRIIDEIRALNSCSVAADAAGLMDQAVLEKFVFDVFCGAASAEAVIFRINFDFDKSNIKEEFIPALEQAVIWLQDRPTMSVNVAGHTDSKGSDQYNQGLSERRANSVTDWLVKNGVDRGRLNPVGYGESQPTATNDTEEGRYLNRRVEIVPQQ